jgi:hypothetical protein
VNKLSEQSKPAYSKSSNLPHLRLKKQTLKTMETSKNIPQKPKRPLTAYNLFSILERNYIVQQKQKMTSIYWLLTNCTRFMNSPTQV